MFGCCTAEEDMGEGVSISVPETTATLPPAVDPRLAAAVVEKEESETTPVRTSSPPELFSEAAGATQVIELDRSGTLFFLEVFLLFVILVVFCCCILLYFYSIFGTYSCICCCICFWFHLLLFFLLVTLSNCQAR
ncbi:unnamed protein product [Polarella glacialis]|uniref:Uncharacterized protein n=1 Tax=Polarella glacialis TaxID=89957 RepID=A0A813JMF4_POLGL|nr:unnamed protein product [Polarella glacialis]